LSRVEHEHHRLFEPQKPQGPQSKQPSQSLLCVLGDLCGSRKSGAWTSSLAESHTVL